jgi:NAD+ synthase (glutamine-hydrolysing)
MTTPNTQRKHDSSTHSDASTTVALNLSTIALGFVRVAVCAPALRVADVAFNTGAICAAIDKACSHKVHLLVLPELCLTGYSCGDLLYQRSLHEAALQALERITNHLAHLRERCGCCDVVLGMPLQVAGKLFNCAVFIANGVVAGVVPKTFLPGTGEFYEERWFSAAWDSTVSTVQLGITQAQRNVGISSDVPFGTELVFTATAMPEYSIGIDICEDGWAAVPPSINAALSGATLLVNISASNEVLGKAEYRRDLVKAHSARCLAAYCYASAGAGESTTDLVFSGHCIIAENNRILGETPRFSFATEMAIADVDVQRMTAERIKNNTFGSSKPSKALRVVNIDAPREYGVNVEEQQNNRLPQTVPVLMRPVNPTPFVPQNRAQRSETCHEIFDIQTTGLAKRLLHTNCTTVVIGVSGGLDSTLALLVCAHAFDKLSLPRTGIVAVTMPGFGTTQRTRGNAEQLAEMLGTTLRVIPIADAVRQHFRDIGHDESLHDITYENAQARERTQILMDVANQMNGIVLGTGDLSELALGWCTYNADQMSMYNVNASIPKTLVRYLVEWCAETEFAGAEAAILHDICATPVSPELLPLQNGSDGAEIQAQETEKTIGPYQLHDFFLYCTVRFQFPPRKVWLLARCAFQDIYDNATLLKWMTVFYRRFFTQQFKRSAMPDGPKVGTVALSPRGDWRMPSDASAALWLQEMEQLQGMNVEA